MNNETKFDSMLSRLKNVSNIDVSGVFKKPQWITGILITTIVVSIIFVVINNYADDPEGNWLVAASILNVILLCTIIVIFSYIPNNNN